MTFAWHLKRLYGGLKDNLSDHWELIKIAPIRVITSYLLLSPSILFLPLFLIFYCLASIFEPMGTWIEYPNGTIDKGTLWSIEQIVWDAWQFLTLSKNPAVNIIVMALEGLAGGLLLTFGIPEAHKDK